MPTWGWVFFGISLFKTVYMSKLTLWNNINWRLSEARVKSIQNEIYSASKQGNVRQVRLLQRSLINCLDAKYVSVRKVTTDSSGKRTSGVDRKLYLSPIAKSRLVARLRIDGKAAPIRRVWIPKPGKPDLRPLGIPTIKDRAKQKLVLLALEPEWEAKFEPNSFGFRPGRSCHDAIEATFRLLRSKGKEFNVRKFVLDADLKGCFDNIDHDYLLNTLNSFPQITSQIRSWLKAGIFNGLHLRPEEYDTIGENVRGTPQGGVISPFLANVALHGMENFLNDWITTQTWPVQKRHQLYRANKIKSLGFVRFADDFIITHSNKDILLGAYGALSSWLASTSKLNFNPLKTRVVDSFQGFRFLGFSIINICRNNVGRVKIYPSRKNQASLVNRVGDRCRKFRSISAFDLIKSLRPMILGWANYFRFCECKEVFSNMDRKIFSIIRAWVFRRDKRHGRRVIKEKYFPSHQTYTFDQRKYNNNWVFCGTRKVPSNLPATIFLPKMSWVKSVKFVSVKGEASVYDGNFSYWLSRAGKFRPFSPGRQRLFNRQGGVCPLCSSPISADDATQVDHIIPLKQGGLTINSNLQLIHTHCHIRKSALDVIEGDQEPDEVNISCPDL
jgi:RNA-directed DNA polymerase